MDNKIPTQISSMEPLMPQLHAEGIETLSAKIFGRIGALQDRLHPITAKTIAALVREMNSYYSNLIEGHHTLPREIERAMQDDFSQKPSEREKQFLGLAHVKTETELLNSRKDADIFSANFISKIHRLFYEYLPQEMRVSESVGGKAYPLTPGSFRDHEVTVGRHQPPAAQSLPSFLRRFAEFYSTVPPAKRLVAAAASHHRLAWIHPFGDGNGRVVRIFSNILLAHWGLDGNMIWSMSRGLARKQKDYYAHLSMADQPRESDLDGRGNLSDRQLGKFCEFYLTTMQDQIDFMLNTLKLESVLTRYGKLLDEKYPKKSALHFRLIKELWIAGEMPRGKAGEIIGKSARTAQEIVKDLESAKLITSDSPKTPIRLQINADTAEEIFPSLYIAS